VNGDLGGYCCKQCHSRAWRGDFQDGEQGAPHHSSKCARAVAPKGTARAMPRPPRRPLFEYRGLVPRPVGQPPAQGPEPMRAGSCSDDEIETHTLRVQGVVVHVVVCDDQKASAFQSAAIWMQEAFDRLGVELHQVVRVDTGNAGAEESEDGEWCAALSAKLSLLGLPLECTRASLPTAGLYAVGCGHNKKKRRRATDLALALAAAALLQPCQGGRWSPSLRKFLAARLGGATRDPKAPTVRPSTAPTEGKDPSLRSVGWDGRWPLATPQRSRTPVRRRPTGRHGHQPQDFVQGSCKAAAAQGSIAKACSASADTSSRAKQHSCHPNPIQQCRATVEQEDEKEPEPEEPVGELSQAEDEGEGESGVSIDTASKADVGQQHSEAEDDSDDDWGTWTPQGPDKGRQQAPRQEDGAKEREEVREKQGDQHWGERRPRPSAARAALPPGAENAERTEDEYNAMAAESSSRSPCAAAPPLLQARPKAKPKAMPALTNTAAPATGGAPRLSVRQRSPSRLGRGGSEEEHLWLENRVRLLLHFSLDRRVRLLVDRICGGPASGPPPQTSTWPLAGDALAPTEVLPQPPSCCPPSHILPDEPPIRLDRAEVLEDGMFLQKVLRSRRAEAAAIAGTRGSTISDGLRSHVEVVKVSEVTYTQDSISPRFRCGRPLEVLISALDRRDPACDPLTAEFMILDAVHVRGSDGRLAFRSLDNRRLYCLKQHQQRRNGKGRPVYVRLRVQEVPPAVVKLWRRCASLESVVVRRRGRSGGQ